jgi:hypothetical protein
MAFYFYESIINEPAELSMLVAVFLTLFLFFFFCFNMRQVPVEKEEIIAEADEDGDEEESMIQDQIPEILSLDDHENILVYEEPDELEEMEELEELAVAEEIDSAEDIKTVLVNPPPASNIRLAFGEDDIPYLVESNGLELVDGDLGEIVSFIQGAESAEPEELLETLSVVASDDGIEAAELEDISTGLGGITIFRQPFAYFLSNPELLHGAASQVIYEQNGIHFINTDFDGDTAGKELDNDFAKLVESVLIPSAASD